MFSDGYYAETAENAFKEINVRVKHIFSISKLESKVPDGANAMNQVFSENNPIIEFCDLSTESGRNIQKGFMQMLSGAMTGLRNPKAHENQILTEEDSWRQIVFASMLMFKIDEAVNYSNVIE